MNKFILLIIISLFFSCLAIAQVSRQRDHDSSFYASYPEKLTARLYLSRKYTALKLNPPGDVPVMKYRSNTTLNIGLGATYKSLTINLGVGLNSFNPDEVRGKTHYLDLQSHFYARKWNFDFLAEFYRGYYMSPKGLGSADGQSYYIRPDLSVQFGGIAVYRALNERNFSYQAGLVQNEWQKKSAGSILFGGETYYGAIHGDSSLAAGILDSAYAKSDIRKVHFFEVGPGVGYAYTFVFKEHYFLLASATINLDFRYTREKEFNANADKVDITPNFIFHAGAGYNTQKWNLSVLWVNDQIHVKGGASGYIYRISTGNYRLNYARRFVLGRKSKKVLQPVNDLIEKTK